MPGLARVKLVTTKKRGHSVGRCDESVDSVVSRSNGRLIGDPLLVYQYKWKPSRLISLPQIHLCGTNLFLAGPRDIGPMFELHGKHVSLTSIWLGLVPVWPRM